MNDHNAATGDGSTKLYYLEILAQITPASALFGEITDVYVTVFLTADAPKSAHRQARALLLDLALLPVGNQALKKIVEVGQALQASLDAAQPDLLSNIATLGVDFRILLPPSGYDLSTDKKDMESWSDLTGRILSAVATPDTPEQWH